MTSPAAPAVSVLLPTHNPHAGRLERTLRGLAAQTLDRSSWEVIVVDNASDRPWSPPPETDATLPGFRVVREDRIGLTPARMRGLREARGGVCVFVDDDNVLSPDHLQNTRRFFAERPGLGSAGGPVTAEWERPPPEWTSPFHSLLALRDFGPGARVEAGSPHGPWPSFAPVGAGLAVRRSAALAYADAVQHDPVRNGLDRTGTSLGSGGDNDLVFSILHAGADVAYFPSLQVTHLIPASRLEEAYLARLNRGIMRTWVRVLALHGHCPWAAIPPWTVRLRYARAALRDRGAQPQARRVRLAGVLGQFEGLADLRRFKLAGKARPKPPATALR